MNVQEIAQTARQTAGVLAAAKTEQKNAVLTTMGEKLASGQREVLAANRADISEATKSGLPGNLIKRLRFGEEKLKSRVRSLRIIEGLPDPVGHMFRKDRLPNGLEVARVRVPLGVVLMVYEARPHVTVNAGAFCLKSGNAAILRGGSEARRCNAVLGELWHESLAEAGLPAEAIQVISGSHEDVAELLQLEDHIDLVIPRGGKGLIRAVTEQSKIPVIKHYEGICHVYVGENADTDKALRIILDSKLLMPEVCNAAETVLVDASMRGWLPFLVGALRDNDVEVRGCPIVRAEVPEVKPASVEDWQTEYLDTILSVRVVEDLDAAIEHIRRFGSGHTDTIVTENRSDAARFTQEVDSAVVLVNASTMFCDGQSLGMGAEIGISTDKLHARGPMGLEELTSYKFVILGDGHVMGEQWR